MNPDDRVVEFITQAQTEDFPDPVIKKAGLVVLDTLGVGLAGVENPAVQKVQQLIDDFPMGPEEATLWGRSKRASCLCAKRGQVESAGKSRQRVGGESPPHGNG